MRTSRMIIAAVFVTASLSHGRSEAALYQLNIETSRTYNTASCWGGPLLNPTADGDGFKNGMLAFPNSALYSAGQRWVDPVVWTTDFYDRTVTGLPADTDDVYFDKAGTTISYFTGHGACDWNGDTHVSCVANSNCFLGFSRSATLPTGATVSRSSFGTGFCRGQPGDTVGSCSYSMVDSRQMLLSDCSHPSSRVGMVGYGSGQVRWGEGSLGGAWAGAGIDGGTNLVVIQASCAEMTKRQNETWAAFAGVHLLATTLVHQGDTGISAIRGSSFAQEYQNNPYSSVVDSWLRAMNSLGAASGPSNWCTNSAGTGHNWGVGGTVSGGYGTNGCGGHAIGTLGATLSEVNSHLAENWFDLRVDSFDGRGNAFWGSRYHCNWDCGTWPVDRP